MVRAILLTLLLIAAPAAAKKRDPAVVENEDEGFVRLQLEEDAAAQAWLFKPNIDMEEGDGKVDLVVALHGAGGNPKNFMMQPLMTKRRAWCLSVAGRSAVNTPRGRGFQWDGSNVKYIAVFVRYLVAKYPIRKERVLVWGHSAGGTMTLRTLAHAPELFAGGLTTAAPGTPSGNHQDVRVCVFLGRQDANWSGAPTVRSYVEKMLRKRKKGACAFFAVGDLGHSVPNSEYLDLGFDWLLADKSRGGEANVPLMPSGREGDYRHILVRFKGAEGATGVKRSKSRAAKLLKKLRKEIGKKRAFFPLEAAIHSEDPESASGGGGIDEEDLLASLPAIPELEPGTMSDILEGKRGLHLVYRPVDPYADS